MDDAIRRLQKFAYAKYVDGGEHEAIDDYEAFKKLQAHFTAPEHAEDADCFLVGVLAFELAFEREDEQEHFFRRAKHWLERHRQLTGEAWDVVDDRLSDVDQYFELKGIPYEAAPLPAPAPPVAVAPARHAPPAPPAAPQPVVYAPQEIDDHGPMMLVPAGSFLFGPERRSVALPAFYIDKYPVTNRQYEQFCRAANYRFSKYNRDERFLHPDAPVVGVSVADAQKYAKWVGKTLPTEEQWEKATRGVDGRAYPWGEAPVTPTRACHGRDPLKGGTQPVTATVEGASPYGVRDLAGNVWEWTNTAVEDGEPLHVIKGGCYNDPPELLRADFRLEAGPKDKHETIGFRLVKSA